MIFILFFVFIQNKAKEAVIKLNFISASLAIFNHLINYLNSNIIEEFNVKACNIFLWHISVCNDTFPCMPIKHTNPLCGNVVS